MTSKQVPNVIVPLSDATDIKNVVKQLDGGTAVFTTDKNLYITEVNETFLNQRIANTYQNVAQTINKITNYPGGGLNGEIQFYKNGEFYGVPGLIFNESTSTVVINGDISVSNVSTFGTGKISAYDMFVSNNINTQQLEVVVGANLGNVGNVIISGLTGSGLTGNAAKADNFLQTDGNGLLTWATVDYPATANFSNFAGNVTVNAQPNITSIANTASVGNIEFYGALSTPHIKAIDDHDLEVGAYNTTGSGNLYAMTFRTTGNVDLATASSGNSVLYAPVTSAALQLVSAANAYSFYKNGTANLSNLVTANFVNGTFVVASNAQPNITSLGTLLSLQVANAGDGNITSENANLGNLLEANYATIANTITSDQSNVSNLFVTANANINMINANDASITGNLVISGNLFINGTTTTVNTSNIQVKDPVISLGGGSNGAALSSNDNKDRGVLLEYYDTVGKSAFMGWDNSNAEFVFSSNATLTNDTATITDLGNIRANYIFAKVTGDLTGNLVNGNSSVNVAANSNVTAVVMGNTTLTVTDTGANITGTANITGNLVVGNLDGGNLTTSNYFSGVFGNATTNVVAGGNTVRISANGTSNIVLVTYLGANIKGDVNVTGNIEAPNLVGVLANGNSNVSISSNANVTISATGNATLVVTDTGANITGTANITGNLAAANVDGGNLVTANNFTGNLVNGTSNVVVDPSGNVRISSASTANVVEVSDTELYAIKLETPTINVTTAVVTTSTTLGIANANATTINVGGAATAINIGASDGVVNFRNNVNISGQLLSNASIFYVANTSDSVTVGSANSTITFANTISVTQWANANNFNATNNVNSNTVNATTVNVTANVNTANLIATANVDAGNFNTAGKANISTLSVTGTSNLNAISNVIITGGSNNQVVQTYGNGTLHWANLTWAGLTDKVSASGPTAISLGKNAGSGTDTVVIGQDAGTGGIGSEAIAIGKSAGVSAGSGSISIGTNSRAISPQSIELNASGAALNAANSGFHVAPVRVLGATSAAAGLGFTVQLYYNPTTGEIAAFTP
jgi:hypothetical protein